MKFSEIISSSWKEFSKKWKSITSAMLVFYLIPALILLSYFLVWFSKNIVPTFLQINLEDANSVYLLKDLFISNYLALIIFILLGFLVQLISLIPKAGLISLSKRTDYNFSKLTNEGLRKFPRMLKYIVTILLVELLIFLPSIITSGIIILKSYWVLLIIPILLFIAGIILSFIINIYWLFGAYICLESEKSVIKSLKKSFGLIKNKWWISLGYILLYVLIILGFELIFNIIEHIANLPLNALLTNTVLIGIMTSFIFNFIKSVIETPFTIIFIKNMYINYSKKKAKSKK